MAMICSDVILASKNYNLLNKTYMNEIKTTIVRLQIVIHKSVVKLGSKYVLK